MCLINEKRNSVVYVRTTSCVGGWTVLLINTENDNKDLKTTSKEFIFFYSLSPPD